MLPRFDKEGNSQDFHKNSKSTSRSGACRCLNHLSNCNLDLQITLFKPRLILDNISDFPWFLAL